MSEKQVIVGPKLLIVVLNRGKNDGNSYGNNYGENSKYNHTVKFDKNLILTNGDEYDLRSVCNRLEYSGKGGHYTAYVKQLGTDVWHHCNDSTIEKLTRQRYSEGSTSFHNCGNAIMMIFSKK